MRVIRCDLGTSPEQSVDYLDYGKAVGERVVSKRVDLGIAVCGTGIGISTAAKKVPRGRHQRRLDKIAAIEREERGASARGAT
ncbi:MAG TPA: RpiB/LacA/LacB family sugar-phosphate isomerase [Candidatus Dormibacteraeota bacterium]|nr:RpiB/LacA/LacB family sugar-phosphate isomerase [Candidatus Dormibacteraeota bacterium]